MLWSPVTEGASDAWVLETASPSFKDKLEPFPADFTEAVDDLFSTFMDTWEACEDFLSRFLEDPSVVSERLEAFSSVGDCAVSVSATLADEDESPLVDVSDVREGMLSFIKDERDDFLCFMEEDDPSLLGSTSSTCFSPKGEVSSFEDFIEV